MTTQMPFVIAHGALGSFDELIFVGVGIVFVAIMIFSWWRSRNASSETLDELNAKIAPHDPATPPDAADRFRLE
ncbi:MAG: hypothetical protein IT320_12520 [Anaerolineae bacterium]|nr:hypothetical protein [Anaerolineae bacterium]